MKWTWKKIKLLLWLGVPSWLNAQTPASNPVELGRVPWLRSLEEASSQAKATGKPILVLFQEIPGCQTCQRYGQEVLSHPLIAEAVATLFVPLAIYNNRGGKDAEVLRAFQEPAWNNPVVRIISADRKDLVPRVSGNFSPFGVLQAMVEALEKKNRPVPGYLALLREEWQSRQLGLQQVTLAMYCFWTGERALGSLPGVVSTQAGYMHGREVVQVAYNPQWLSLDKLLQQAGAQQCADQVFAHNPAQLSKAASVVGTDKVKNAGTFRADPENKYALYRSAYRYVPMTPLQATRCNALLGNGHSPDHLLSPQQLSLLRQVRAKPQQKWPAAIGLDIYAAADLLAKP